VQGPGGGTPAGAADAPRHNERGGEIDSRSDHDGEGAEEADGAGDVDAAEGDPASDGAAAGDVPEAPRVRRFGAGSGRGRGARLVKADATEGRLLSPRERIYMLDLWQRSGLPARDFGALVGISRHTLYSWKQRFAQQGPAGLEDGQRGGPRGSKLDELTKRAILMLKKEHPDYGCERISDMLFRGPALAASPSAVARLLKESGYETEEVATRPHAPPVRQFERAEPNQLWQTDLFTFVLKRQNTRVYLVAFMDDHSRFVVGYGLHASQSTALTLEVLRAAISGFGTPEEILTDNGSQYVTWRGKSAFTKELEKRGIRQIVARPRHPQTLGKIERFWGTLWRECLETSVFRDLADARARTGHFIDHYNFQRPHQSLDGHVPGDRFFRAAPEVKKALLARVQANALELARGGTKPAPFYLTGQVGGKGFSVHAEGEQVFLTREAGAREEVSLVSPEKAAEAKPRAVPPAVAPDGSPPPEEVTPGARDQERSFGRSPLDGTGLCHDEEVKS
jgi:transposase InsO family protein